MTLITGGACQGKLAYARGLFEKERDIAVADGESAGPDEILCADIWNHFHRWVRRMLETGEEPGPALEEILSARPDLVIVTQEVGCGLVPVDAFERKYRETAGRLGCRLAKRAGRVVLVTCGIPMTLKGEEEKC